MAGTDHATPPPPPPPTPDGWKAVDGDPAADLKTKQRTLTGALFDFPVPTIAALPGAAAGAGASLALACDLRVAAAGAAFVTTAYADIGLPGDYGGTWTLTQLVGTSKARELCYTCDRVYADEGLRLGLFNRVVPAERLMDETLKLARQIASKPTLTLRRLKDNLNAASSGSSFLAALDHEAANLVAHTSSDGGRAEFQAMRERFQRKARSKM